MKTLITGAGGMLAREAIRYCDSIGDTTIGLSRTELDISDSAAVQAAIKSLMPDIVLNCAAYTNVDGAESEIERCRAANVIGVENLARECRNSGTVFVTVSTDYVFDGKRDGFYTEEDEPNPSGIYAVSKFDGEKAAQSVNEKAIIARSGWIFGCGGTNFLSVMHQFLGAGKPITAICDSYGTPTYAEDLALRLREMAEKDVSGVFHIANSGGGTSYLGFAEALCEIGGFDAGLVDTVSFHDLNRPAPRPVNSKLASIRADEIGLAPLPEWKNAIQRFLAAPLTG